MAKTTINTTSKVEKVEKVEEMEKIVLNNVDHEWSDVLKYISSGKDVVFEAEPELILPEPHSEVYKALPFPIQFQWTQTKAISKYMKELQDDDEDDRAWVSDVKVGLSPNSFQDRFSIQGKRDDRCYYWPRPEQIDLFAAKGWVVEKSPEINTVGPQPNGEHHIIINGKCIHVLMSQDKVLHDKVVKAQADRQKKEMFGKTQNDGAGNIMTQAELERTAVDVENG